MVSTCPTCGKSVTVQDVVISGVRHLSTVRTCGRVIVEARGRLTASRIEAVEGVVVEGCLEAAVETRGPVSIGAGAVWKGDCRAGSVRIAPGARVEGGCFRVGESDWGSEGEGSALPET